MILAYKNLRINILYFNAETYVPIFFSWKIPLFNIIFVSENETDFAGILMSRGLWKKSRHVRWMRITEIRLRVLLHTARESCYQDTTKVVVLCGTCIHEEHGRARSRLDTRTVHTLACRVHASAFMHRIEHKPQRNSLCLARALLRAT